MKILIKNGRLIDPANNIDKTADVLVENGKIAAIGAVNVSDIQIIDASGMWIMPGFIDLHVHFREPGQTHKEDLESGSKSAVKGGFTTVCTMPNTSPTADNADEIDFQIKRAAEIGLVDILPVGAITSGLKGQNLANIEEMVASGAVGITEDGFTVKNAALQMQAMQTAANLGIVVFSHCEDEDLAKANETAAAEDVITARDIILAEKTGVKLHLCHVSTANSVRLIKEAKARGANITAEAAPHHFCLCDEDFDGADTNFKMNPPLRNHADKQAVLAGIVDGTIDIIATDHAPHHADEKAQDYAIAPNGIVGLETALAISFTHLVSTGLLTPSQLAEKMSHKPAAILGINKGNLAVGCSADITVINPSAAYKINPDEFASKGRNTPFGGHDVQGRVVYTIFGGKITYKY